MDSKINHKTEMLEDKIDLEVYDQAMDEHKEDPLDISFDEMMIELGLEEHDL